MTDFGLSVVKGGVTPDSMMQDFCGTPIYMGQFTVFEHTHKRIVVGDKKQTKNLVQCVTL